MISVDEWIYVCRYLSRSDLQSMYAVSRFMRDLVMKGERDGRLPLIHVHTSDGVAAIVTQMNDLHRKMVFAEFFCGGWNSFVVLHQCISVSMVGLMIGAAMIMIVGLSLDHLVITVIGSILLIVTAGFSCASFAMYRMRDRYDRRYKELASQLPKIKK